MFANGVKETTTTTGTGTVTLSSVTGRVRFSEAFPVAGSLVAYAINSGNDWEWGIGKTAASNTLERSKVLATYVSGTYNSATPSAITLAGTSTVTCTEFAEALSGGARSLLIKDTGLYISVPHSLANSIGTGFYLSQKLYAIPYVPDISFVMSSISVRVMASEASKSVRLGIYRADPNTFLPTSLLVDFGEVSIATTGMKTITATQQLNAGEVYWFSVLSETNAGTAALAGIAQGQNLGMLGLDSAGSTAICKVEATQAYGTLPSTFPTLTFGATEIPRFFLKR